YGGFYGVFAVFLVLVGAGAYGVRVGAALTVQNRSNVRLAPCVQYRSGMNAAQIEAVYAAFGAAVDGVAPRADYSFDRAVRLAAAFYSLSDDAADEAPESAPTVPALDLATVRPR